MIVSAIAVVRVVCGEHRVYDQTRRHRQERRDQRVAVRAVKATRVLHRANQIYRILVLWNIR
jgi:hypothetical protein